MKLWQRLGQILLIALCLMFWWKLTSGFEASEFSFGRITGPLLKMSDIGSLLFVGLAVPGLKLPPRITSGIAGIASLLCLPLSLLFVAPGPFRTVVGGEWSVSLSSDFVLTKWTLGWFLALLASLSVSVVVLVWPKPKQA